MTLGAAVAGALLGHSAGATLTAPPYAIVGAAAAANLALLLLDRHRHHPPASEAVPADQVPVTA